LNNKVSDKDKKAWEEFLSSDEKLPNKDLNTKRNRIFKTKYFDLHGYTLDEANKKIDNLINYSFDEGIKKLVIITGKGLHSQNEKDPYVSKDLGILKYSVPENLKKNKELMKKIIEIKDADLEDGGDGAFYIFLKNKFR
tara:strand:- start:631 stop:1047 length:417 start_codon:yes stop_codon:yes gene_type:complete